MVAIGGGALGSGYEATQRRIACDADASRTQHARRRYGVIRGAVSGLPRLVQIRPEHVTAGEPCRG